MKKLYYVPIGVIILILIIIPAIYFTNKDKAGILPSFDLSFSKLKISSVKDNAFGSLKAESASNNVVQADGRGVGSASLSAPTAEAESAMVTKGIGSGGGGGMAVSMPNPYSVRYNFIYNGEDIATPDSDMPVLKRYKNDGLARNFTKTISDLNFGLLNTNKFKNQELTNFNINEDREFGYSIYFNLIENVITINSNWNKWPRPEDKCRKELGVAMQNCYESFRLKEADVPTDEKIITIADQFMKDYGLKMSNYGPGEVQDNWRRNYGLAESRELIYVPDSIPVVYPLLINGQTVYDESGNKTGLNVEVNIRYNKVSGVHNIMVQNFQSSNYETETDGQRIIKIAQTGGYQRIYDNPNAEKTVDIKLGTPSLELVKIWKYNEETKQGDELLVPFYIFPILEMPTETYFWQKNIIVPAVKELMDEIEDRDKSITPIPMPMPEPMMPEGGMILEEKVEISNDE